MHVLLEAPVGQEYARNILSVVFDLSYFSEARMLSNSGGSALKPQVS